jgi:nucleotide-binding universal stress UspA family protein
MNILLATDGSDSAKAALDFLVRFPFPHGSSATIVTIIDDTAIQEEEAEQFTDEQTRLLQDTRKVIQEDAEQLLEDEAHRLRDAGWTGTTELRSGNPAEEIIRIAEELKVDLVILGSHGWGGIKEFLLGSVSHKVLEHAPCSVLVVKRRPAQLKETEPASTEAGSEQHPWRIVVAYDDSAPAKKAVELCASLPFDKTAEVIAVSVMPMITMYRQDIRQQLDPIFQQKKHTAKTALDAAVNAMRWSTPNVSARLLEGSDVSKTILDTAAQTDSDLIMLGCMGKGAVMRFLLGSTSHHVARHAACAVWVVRN